MPTNGEVFEGLERIKTGFFIPNKKETGKSVALHMHDISSILAFKGLSTNLKIKQSVKSQHQELKPKEAVECANINFEVDDSIFTDENKRDLPFNSNFMFVGLNLAFRPETYQEGKKWYQFHDTKIIRPMFNLATMTNHERFRGCYITDILKNVVDSNSNNVTDDYLADKDQEKESLFRKSAQLFIEECEVIQPKHLIVFGGGAKKTITEMANEGLFDKNSEVKSLVNDALEVTHYSHTMGTEQFMDYFNDEEASHTVV